MAHHARMQLGCTIRKGNNTTYLCTWLLSTVVIKQVIYPSVPASAMSWQHKNIKYTKNKMKLYQEASNSTPTKHVKAAR